MGCGCGGSKGAQTQFVHVDPKGNETVTRSQVEANAKRIREGGTVERRTVTSTR